MLTVVFRGEATPYTGSAAVVASYEQNWADPCQAPTDFVVDSVEGNVVTTSSTATLPSGIMVRPSVVYEVSEDGLIVSLEWIEGPVVTEDS